MKLYEYAHTRAGDKGDVSDITVIAYDLADFPFLERELSAELVRHHFRDVISGDVERYEVPQLGVLKFVLHGALGGGVTRSLRLDSHGKALSSLLLEVNLPRMIVRDEFEPVTISGRPIGGS